MTLVLDSSAVAAALVHVGAHGAWAENLLSGDELAAPHHMPSEVTNVLRRSVLAGELSEELASLAHIELLELRFTPYSYALLADRIWELRANITPYDAWYVALAETLDAPLATLDNRLTRAPGTRCTFLTPP